MTLLHRIVYGILWVVFLQGVSSQSISGYVADCATGRSLGYCNIFIEGTSRGTAANADGYYSLNLPPGSYLIKFQYLGYHSFSTNVTITRQLQILDVNLTPQVVSLDPITVYATQKSGVEELILKASRMKEKSRFIRNYFCHSYTKTSYRSVVDPSLYGGIFETFSELYFNAPDTWHEILLSQRQSANLPQSVNFVSGNTFIDMNADRIKVGNHTLVGLTAKDAIDHYIFQILDTLYQDHKRIFKICFSPRDLRIPSMGGELYLVDKFFIIDRVDVALNPGCNYGLFENIHIVQRYKALNDSMYLPVYALRENEFVTGIPGMPVLLMRKENFRENYRVNDLQNQIAPNADVVKITPEIPFKSVPMFIPPLTLDETIGYKIIDSLVVHNRRLNVFTRVIKWIDLYSEWKTKPIGEISDFVRFNRIEGGFAGAAFDSKSMFSLFALQFGIGYGFADDKLKFHVIPSARWGNRRLSLNASLKWYQILSPIEDPAEYPLLLNSLRGIFGGFDYYDYYYNAGRQVEVTLNYSLLDLTTAVLYERHSPATIGLTHGILPQPEFLDNPVISHGEMAGFRVKATLSNIKFLNSALSRRIIPNQHFTQLELGYETGVKSIGSDYSYDRYLFILTTRRNMTRGISMDLRLEAGFSLGVLPRQKYFEVQGGSADFDLLQSFSTLVQNSLTGSQKLVVFSEFHIGKIFHWATGIPLINSIPWEVSLITHAGWAGEKALNRLTFPDMVTETGIGIDNFFHLFKIEVMFSGVETEYRHPFALTVKIEDFDIF